MGSPLLNGSEQRTAHIVRPVVFANSPVLRHSQAVAEIKPAGIVIGQKSQVPVGRAQAQPRVNMANIGYSPYSTVRVRATEGTSNDAVNEALLNENEGGGKFERLSETKPLRNSTEDINDINVHEIDHMIDTLQQLQQEFTER